MGMYVSMWVSKAVFCPHCGEIATYEVDNGDDEYLGSGGAVWHDFLPTIGGKIPYEDPNDLNERYGQDYALTKEEISRLVDFIETNHPYNYQALLSVCYKSLAKYDSGYRLTINADW